MPAGPTAGIDINGAMILGSIRRDEEMAVVILLSGVGRVVPFVPRLDANQHTISLAQDQDLSILGVGPNRATELLLERPNTPWTKVGA